MTSNTFTIAFLLTLFLIILHPTHQYVYSCNSSASCGCSNSPASMTRIVGGEAAGSSSWGWAVSLYIGGSLCGGAILSSQWIVTAAHCVNTVSASQVTVYAGSNTRFSGQSRIASSIIVHPSYSTTTSENDIALIRLSSVLTMSDPNVKTICMPSVSSTTLAAGEWPPAGLYVAAVGWGRLTESGSLPSTLQQVTVQTIAYSASFCSSVLNNRQKQFCAGVNGGGKDTCQGDSGGPLMMFTTSNQWVLVGVTSYGIGCARPTYAGVYTRVAYYQSWISTTTSSAYTNAASSNSANISPFTATTSVRTNVSSTIFSQCTLCKFMRSSVLLLLSMFLIMFDRQ